MTTVRQRLLLIAGWVLAAIGSALIASGAVAVAGGQVSDRVLQPLSAAEVEALLEQRGTDTAFASGGSTSFTGTTAPRGPGTSEPTQSLNGDQEPAARTAEPDVSDQEGLLTVPDLPDRTPTAPSFTFTPRRLPSETILRGIDEVDPTEGDIGPDLTVGSGEERSLAAIYQVDGGSVAVAGVEPKILLLWATPRAGFVGDFSYSDNGTLSISFTSQAHRSTVVVEWLDGELIAEVGEADAL